MFVGLGKFSLYYDNNLKASIWDRRNEMPLDLEPGTSLLPASGEAVLRFRAPSPCFEGEVLQLLKWGNEKKSQTPPPSLAAVTHAPC